MISEVVRKRLKELVGEMENVDLVGEARDAIEALEMLNDLDPDTVILDIRMPGGNGMAIMKELAARKNPPIVIVYTSFAYPQYRQAYLEAGADYFFDKAEDTDALLQVLSLHENNHKTAG